MSWLLIIALVVVLCFGLGVFVGAPYLPTLQPQVETALKLAQLKPGQTLLELGCGDGKVMIAAAKQGIKTVGYELNPLLALFAWARTRRHRKLVKVIWGNFWRREWPHAEAVFVFLLPKYMSKLDKKIVQYSSHNVKLVSFAFEIPGKTPVTVQDGVFLYDYPAKLANRG